MDFKLVSDYAPTGDQPEAIAQLVGSIEHGSKHNTLLGVTGSGKNLHRSQRHRRPEPSDARAEPQQDPRGAALRRIQELLPGERRGVFRVVLRLLPAGGLSSGDGHLYRERPLDQRRDREDAAQHRGHAALGAARRGGGVERLVSLRLRQPRGFPRHGHHAEGRAGRQLQALPIQARRGALHPHRTRAGAGDVPRERRHGGHHGRLRRVRQPVLPRDVLRQRGGGHPVDRPRDGAAHPLARHPDALPHESLRHHEGTHPCRRAADLPRPGQTDRVLRAFGPPDGGPAHQAARGVRPRNDQGGWATAPASRTIRAIWTAGPPGRAPSVSSTTSRRTTCWSWTRATSRCRRSTPCSAATAPARRTSWSTDSGFRRPRTTAR